MYDEFHAHLAGTNLKTQESSMHWRLKGLHTYMYKEEMYMLHKDSEIMQMIQKVLKTIQINSNINSFSPISQQYLIETLSWPLAV